MIIGELGKRYTANQIVHKVREGGRGERRLRGLRG